MESSSKSNYSIGFLTVRQHPSHGYFGGYLILNSLARPLEFHCTLPVQPSRAQQILYGATLNEFVCGEQIARSLLQKAKLSPDVVLTDTLAALSVRHVQDTPIAAIEDSWLGAKGDFAHPSVVKDRWHRFEVGEHQLQLLTDYSADQSTFIARQDALAALDLVEPFGRIEEALMEAHPNTKAA
jgi:hypothetical protein